MSCSRCPLMRNKQSAIRMKRGSALHRGAMKCSAETLFRRLSYLSHANHTFGQGLWLFLSDTFRSDGNETTGFLLHGSRQRTTGPSRYLNVQTQARWKAIGQKPVAEQSMRRVNMILNPCRKDRLVWHCVNSLARHRRNAMCSLSEFYSCR